MAVEGGTLNWLFKNILRFAGWAPCEVFTGSKAPWFQAHGSAQPHK
jgi:hypothetical protein